METRKIILWIHLIILIAAVLISCEKAANFPGANKPLGISGNSGSLGAGANFVLPNNFNSAGNLYQIGGTYNTQLTGTPMEIWMGVGNENAGTLAGHVTFLHNPNRVTIDLTDADGNPGPDFFPFVVTAAHIHFAPTVDGIPHTENGNPIPGQFEYNVHVDPFQTKVEVPVEFDAVGAIHLSVVKYGGIEGFNFYLPDNPVTLRIVDYPDAGNPTYFKLKVTNGGFISDFDMGSGSGIYEGWCVDIDHTINLNQDYPARMYSSYEPLPSYLTGEGLIEFPEKLDKINYLVNSFVTGQLVQPLNSDCSPAATGLQPLTYSDIQREIWHYIDDNQSTAGLSSWDELRVNAIICQVDRFGENFVPACNQKVVFLIVPQGPEITFQIVIGQPVIGAIQVPCETVTGTAWGDGKYGASFPEAKKWGTWFKVCF